MSNTVERNKIESKHLEVREIKPDLPWHHFEWRELWEYRYLIKFFSLRDLSLIYKQTIFGPLHLFIRPFVTTLLFQLVFSKLGNMPTDGVHPFLFYYVNNTGWAFFSSNFGSASAVFLSGKGLMTRVYFPRIIPPFSALITNAVNLSIQLLFALLLVVGFDWYYGTNLLSVKMFGFFVPIIQLGLIGMGMGFIMACLTLKYRDLSSLSNLITQGLMYLSPVIYPLALVPEKFRLLASFNPITSAMEALRYFIFSNASLNAQLLLIGWGITLLLFMVGLISFNIVQRKFVDVV